MPQETHVSSRQVHLNSDDADFTNEKNFLFFFNDIITSPPNVQMLVTLVNATIPMSFYVVTENNNKLVVNLETYIIPTGNYTILEIINLIETNISILTNIIYSKITNKISMTGSSSFFLSATSTCHRLLGFSKGIHSSSTNILTSDRTVNVAGVSSIFVHTNLLTDSIDSRTGGYSNLLARIPVDASRNGFLNFSPDISFRAMIANRTIDFITVSLEDDDNNNIDLNGQHFQLTLQFDFQYTRELKPPISLLKKSQV